MKTENKSFIRIKIKFQFLLILFASFTFSALGQVSKGNNKIGIQDNSISITTDSSAKAKDFLDKGNKELTLKNFKKALTFFNQAIRYDKRLDKAYIQKTIAYYKLKQYSFLLGCLDSAIQINPFNHDAYYLRGTFRYRIHAFEEQKLDSFLNVVDFQFDDYYNEYPKEAAINDFAYAISIFPEDAKSYFRMGVVMTFNQQCDKAIEAFEKSIALATNNLIQYQANYAIANCYLINYNANGGTDLAKKIINCLSRAIKINPNFLKAYELRASMKSQIEDNYGALDDYQIANTISPNSQNSNIGDLKIKLGDYAGAISIYTKSISLTGTPTSAGNKQYIADLYWNRGKVKLEIKDYQGAISDCSKAIELLNSIKKSKAFWETMYDDNLGRYYHSRGIAECNNKQKELGCIDLSRALNLGFSVQSDIDKYCK